MHQTALLGEAVKDAKSFGWQVEQPQHEWKKMVEEVGRKFTVSLFPLLRDHCSFS